MQYNRNEMSDLNNFKPFSEGVHNAVVSNVINKKSKSGKDMFEFSLEGTNGETGNYWLTFGLEWSEASLNRVLASVEDNNQQIAPIDYGYNQGTLDFLKGKRVFIQAKDKTGTYIDRNGEEKQSVGTDIKNFLTKEEFFTRQKRSNQGTPTQTANNNTFQQSLPGTDPFAEAKSISNGGINISDDDLPF
ncbi:MAG: single-stranded DNA-binding protein [Enterococcus sp.]|uniref:single-stranded DNA-binding protein n=1 Tax=Enterococcus sp. TaxID=35783 RepID=UPI002FC7019C